MVGRTPPVDDEVESDGDAPEIQEDDDLPEGEEPDEGGGQEDADPEEGGGDGDEEGADVGDEPPARQPSRAASRFQRLANENRELKDRLDKIERGSQQPTGPSQAELDRQRAEQQRLETEELERAALEGPAAAARVAAAQAERRMQNHLRGLEFRQADHLDKMEFRDLCRDSPALAKMSDRVEDKLAEYRRNGNNPSRSVVAKFLLGEDALARAKGAQTRQQKRGAARLDRERVRTTRGGRSDVGQARRTRRNDDSVEALEERLRDVNI